MEYKIKKHCLRILEETRIRSASSYLTPQTPEERLSFILDSKAYVIYW